MTSKNLVAQYRDICICVQTVPLDMILYQDRDDECVLECAVSAGADIIVSGDHHLIDLRSFEGIRILTAREMLDLMGRD